MLKKIIKRILYTFYFIFDKILYKRKLKILNANETVKKIYEEKYSVSRFGDGELKWIFGVDQKSFQDLDENLSNDLKKSFMTTKSNCLIGIPMALNSVEKYNFEAKFYWTRFKCKYHKELSEILDYEKEYCDASFTRPYIDFDDKSHIKEKFDNIKKIWDDKSVLIVEGEGVNFGFGNDLLSNCKSIERIICPSSNAYMVIDNIYESICKNYNNQIILVALGPTASILCEKLSSKKCQAIDIGHLDVEYCWFINNCKSKVGIEGKNVNEKNKDKISLNIKIDENKLKSEIIDIIKISGD